MDDTDADYTVSYAYDAENRLNAVTDAAETHAYTYDTDADRLSERASDAFDLKENLYGPTKANAVPTCNQIMAFLEKWHMHSFSTTNPLCFQG